jgi:hypothetical protein
MYPTTRCLGPGAAELLDVAKIDPNTSCNRLTFDQFSALAAAYQRWPKKPRVSQEELSIFDE